MNIKAAEKRWGTWAVQMPARAVARLALGVLWLLHLLPLPVLAFLGRGLGRLLLRVSASRRRVAQRNIDLCLTEWDHDRRQSLVTEHFEWLGRSLLERSLLWWAPRGRLERMVEVRGDVSLAERTPGPFMWVVPHFLALEMAGLALQLRQTRMGAALYQPQSNPVFDGVMRKGRLRFGRAIVHSRHHNALKLLRDIRGGAGFLNLPDMDFGLRDAAFVPFFGQDAATLLAPARMARTLKMTVQPVLTEILPGGQGYRVTFCRGAGAGLPGTVPVGPPAIQDEAARAGFGIRLMGVSWRACMVQHPRRIMHR